MIITAEQGDTLSLLSEQYGIPIKKIAADNGITDNVIVPGQALYIGIPSESLTLLTNDTVSNISNEYKISEKQLFRNNFILGGRNDIPLGTFIVLDYQAQPDAEKIIGGYAYDFISTQRLFSVINYLTYIMPFTYGFTSNGMLISPDDTFILSTAKKTNVKALMHISTLTSEGYFDSSLPSFIFEDEQVKNRLINNIIEKVSSLGYDGVDIDFEYLTLSQKEGYIAFTKQLSDALHALGKILVIAVPPMTSREQRGVLVDGIDYESLGENADYVLIMAYEYAIQCYIHQVQKGCMKMRKNLKEQIKQYLKEYPKEMRKEHHMTQNEMSEHLCMDVRAYSDLEHGKNTFSLVSFMLLLWELGERKFDVIEDLMYIISKSKNDSGE